MLFIDNKSILWDVIHHPSFFILGIILYYCEK